MLIYFIEAEMTTVNLAGSFTTVLSNGIVSVFEILLISPRRIAFMVNHKVTHLIYALIRQFQAMTKANIRFSENTYVELKLDE